MRGDQLARQWRVIRAIEASPGGLTVAEIANFPSTLEALQAAGFPLYTERVEKANRWAFIDTFKFKIPAPFALTEFISLYFYKDCVWVFKGTPFHDSIDSVFKKIKSTLFYSLAIAPRNHPVIIRGNGEIIRPTLRTVSIGQERDM